MTKKLLVNIVAMFALTAAAVAAPIGLTANAKYHTKYIDNGVVTFEDVVVAGVSTEVYGFVAGVTTYNTLRDETTGYATVGKTQVSKISAAGLFKRTDLSLGYKFTSPLANLTVGGTYKNFSKSVSPLASNTEPYALLNGTFFGTKATWDASYRNDLKNHTNNTEANLRLPFGFKSLKLVPAFGYGFNDLGADTIAAYKNAKQYAIVGLGIGYYTKYATVSLDYAQRRDGLFTAGNTVNTFSGGLSVKF